MSKTKEFEIKVEGKEWESAIDAAYKKANQNFRIDGFRKGKAPKNVFMKNYGKERVHFDAANEVIEDAYKKMSDENKDILTELVAEPEIEVKSLMMLGLYLSLF